jgi:hypothetical protein
LLQKNNVINKLDNIRKRSLIVGVIVEIDVLVAVEEELYIL